MGEWVCQTLPAQSLSCPRPSPTSPRRPPVLPALPSAPEAGRSPTALKGSPAGWVSPVDRLASVFDAMFAKG